MACHAKSRCKQNIPKINTRQGCETDIGWPFGGRRTPAWRWQNGRKATVGGQNGSCCIAIRPVLRPRKACFMAQKRPSGRPFLPVSACFSAQTGAECATFGAQLPMGQSFAESAPRMAHLRPSAPDGRRRRSQRGCCKHCSPFLTVSSRAGRSAASR